MNKEMVISSTPPRNSCGDPRGRSGSRNLHRAGALARRGRQYLQGPRLEGPSRACSRRSLTSVSNATRSSTSPTSSARPKRRSRTRTSSSRRRRRSRPASETPMPDEADIGGDGHEAVAGARRRPTAPRPRMTASGRRPVVAASCSRPRQRHRLSPCRRRSAAQSAIATAERPERQPPDGQHRRPAQGRPGDRRPGGQGAARHQGRAHHVAPEPAGTVPRLHADGRSHRRVAQDRLARRAPPAAHASCSGSANSPGCPAA